MRAPSDGSTGTPFLRTVPEGSELLVHVQPRARQTRLAGLHGDRLKIRVASPPVEGQANAELCGFLSRELGVPKSAVSLNRGGASRQKSVLIRGLAPATVAARLGV